MDAPLTTSGPIKVAGTVLIVAVGLLNFHVPHFLFQAPAAGGTAGYMLEVVLLANVVAALVAAVGIYRGSRWGWLLGIVVACIAVVFYVAQESVGLPGLPRNWLEPSRLLSLLVEGAFFILATRQLLSGRQASGDRHHRTLP
jgi:hypothetical protein